MKKECEKCNTKWLWFRIKNRWYISPIGRVKSKLKICPQCGKGLNNLFKGMKMG